MTKQNYLSVILLALTSVLIISQHSIGADIEWTINQLRSLDSAPIDIASSSDGQWIYVLSSGGILIYSVLDQRVVGHIPVDKSFDRISYSEGSNTLYVSSSTARVVWPVQLELVQKFSLDGLAFKGPKNAPVTIAVFSDYQ